MLAALKILTSWVRFWEQLGNLGINNLSCGFFEEFPGWLHHVIWAYRTIDWRNPASIRVIVNLNLQDRTGKFLILKALHGRYPHSYVSLWKILGNIIILENQTDYSYNAKIIFLIHKSEILSNHLWAQQTA